MAATMPTHNSEGEILTIKQVADYLKVTERTIYRLAGAKKIPAFKVGGTWRFSRVDIDNWIKQQSLEGLEEPLNKSGQTAGASDLGTVQGANRSRSGATARICNAAQRPSPTMPAPPGLVQRFLDTAHEGDGTANGQTNDGVRK